MKTRIVKSTLVNLRLAARLIKSGEVVAFPTETIYGLGADAFNREAVRKIFAAKGRPSDNPVIVHISSFDMLKDVAIAPRGFEEIARKFWPGPVTFILPKRELVPVEVTGGLDTVAVRMPDNKITLKLIELSGVPIAAPSANTSTRPSPTSVGHVLDDLDGKIPLVIDGGASKHGVESTVIRVDGRDAVVYRLGALSLEDLEKVFSKVSFISKTDVARSPGVKYKHYAPSVPVVFVTGDAAKKINAQLTSKAVVFCSKKLNVKCKQVVVLDSKVAARKLFGFLRSSEKNFDLIFVCERPERGLGRTFNERARRAASLII